MPFARPSNYVEYRAHDAGSDVQLGDGPVSFWGILAEPTDDGTNAFGRWDV